MEEVEFRHCAFCLRTKDESPFGREHMFPHAIGGRLFFDNFICEDCNNRLGANIDCLVFESREIIEAVKKFNLSDDANQYLNKNFDISLDFEGHEIKAKAEKDSIKPLPHKVNDDHLIVPEEQSEEIIRKTINRDERLKEIDLDPDIIKKETADLLKRYEEATEGEKVESKILGRVLVKNTNQSKPKITPKSEKDNLRLVCAKIAYEFLSLVAYAHFISSKKLNKVLFDTINHKEVQKGLVIERVQSPFDDFQPLHTVILEINDTFTLLLISFFGTITYQIFAPPFETEFLKFHAKNYDIEDLVGFHFEENFDQSTKKFFGINENNERIPIAGI
ncbi:MAG: HNH endonuclease [Balneolaceae bacterium]|nr:HNH endonuclease [Balneolaceae bacterium]